MVDKAEAVQKLNQEMIANSNQPYVQVVGQYLQKHLEAKPEHAEHILAEDKTILKSLDVMRRFAERKRVGNVAVLTDEEGFAVVLQYFGCWDGEPFDLPPEPQRPAARPIPQTTKTVPTPRPTTRRTKAAKSDDDTKQISLFDTAELN